MFERPLRIKGPEGNWSKSIFTCIIERASKRLSLEARTPKVEVSVS